MSCVLYLFCNNFHFRGDFQVMSGITKEEESVSVFWFLEVACHEMREVSFRLLNKVRQPAQNQGKADQRPLHDRFCYIRMMWSK